MEFVQRTSLSESEKHSILDLWNHEYPENLSYESKEDFDRYLESLSKQSHLLIMDATKKLKGWYVDFIRENEKWFVILLDSDIHGKGIGTKLLARAKQKENELNGWVIDHNRDKKKNGKYYISPLNFYLKNGFKKLEGHRLELDNLSAIKIKWKK